MCVRVGPTLATPFSFSPVLLALGIQHTSEAEKVKVTCPDAPNVLRRSSGSAPAR